MKIYTNKLTRHDLIFEFPVGVWGIDGVRKFTPRKSSNYENGYELFLSGSSTYAASHDTNYKAATWDEYGIWMDRLFKIDPDAKIGIYNNYQDFIEKTTDEYNRNKLYTQRKYRTAPWLSHN